jgi:RNA-directed DNA polymerase
LTNVGSEDGKAVRSRRPGLMPRRGACPNKLRPRCNGEESALSFHQTTTVSRFVKVQGNKSPYGGDWVYWSTRLGRDPSKPRRVTRLLKRQRGCCALCGLRFTTQDVVEVHHHDRNHNNNAFDNLRLMHGHCHDIVHGSRR